ncbi:hypothetical protein [Agrobacterium rosae]|uniref:hypothetical protein n=1 Tax=Agrobacterium rosae TaxID=1972867 RepID=UPI00097DAB09|nr:hypothetical protein [Agrobacterium rosae]
MLNAAFDAVQGEVQEIHRDVSRTAKAPFGANGPTFPAPDPSKVIGWDVDGNFVNVDPADFVEEAGFATADQGAKADTAVQPERGIATGLGLTGGGDLSSDRTIELSAGSVASLNRADSALQPLISV